MLAALPRMSDGERAVEVALACLDDPELEGHAIEALRLIDAKRARQRVERFVDHPTAWIRKEAKAALRRFDRR